MNNKFLEFMKLTKSYSTTQGEFVVVENFELTIAQGEFVSLIGHSGCGKSTVLMMVAGLTEVSSGHIFLATQQIDRPGPDRGIVFQAPSLLPWLTALDNVMLGVRQVFPHASKKQKEDICKYYLSRVGLQDDFYKKASDLSNGMKQRVGIARAFALKPKMLLLDEPFGMLDSLTRVELQDVLLDVWSKERITALMVTHDVDEAIFLSDRVVMMTSGPRARVGKILNVEFKRPRQRKEVLEDPRYYDYRGDLLNFLEGKDVKKKFKPSEKRKVSKVSG